MRKVSKILVMAIVVLAVITMSLNVNAATANENLTNYIKASHNVNGMVFELTNSQKNSLVNYVKTLDEKTAETVYSDIISIEETIKNTGAKNVSEISETVKSEILEKATETAKKAGLTLTVNTKTNTFKLVKSSGEVLISGNYTTILKSSGTSSSSKATATSSTGSKLLYTGANYAVYALPALTIVAAIAIFVKKRAK